MSSTLINPAAVPQVMQLLPQWVLWRYEKRGKSTTKVPVQVSGNYAKTNDSTTWCDFSTAVDNASRFDGAGFVFAGDNLTGVDLDGAVDPFTGEVESWASAILQSFRATYIEFSPSGTGYHLVCHGRPIHCGKKEWHDAKGEKHGVEVYDKRSPRYFTVTGDTFNAVQPVNCQDALDEIYEEYFTEPEPERSQGVRTEYDDDALIDALNSISPEDYEVWIRVGMALKAGGYDCHIWDRWSSGAQSYKPGVCSKKWGTFKGHGLGPGTIFHMAGRRNVYRSSSMASLTTSTANVCPKEDSDEEEFTVREWPTLHDDALHGLAGRIVVASVESSEADPAAVLATLLVRAGATFGRHAFAKIGDDRHYPLLFGMVVGASAMARKGTSAAPIDLIFKDAEERLGSLPLRVASGLSSGEGIIAAVRDHKDASGEEKEDEGISDKRILVIESEFAGPLKAMQRQGNNLSVILRDCWDKRELSILTKKNPLTASEPHVSILGHITKDELAELLAKVELSNGLVNRFLWFCSRRSKILAFPEGLNPQAQAHLASDLADSLRRSKSDRAVHFDEEAAEFYRELYTQIAMAETGGIVGSITARGPAYIRRVSLIYSLLEGDTTIRIEHLKAAKAVWDYCLASANYIFGSATTPQDSAMTLNDRVMRALADGDKTQSELTAKFKKVAKATQLSIALAELQAIGRVTQRTGVSKGGREPTYWSAVEVR